MGLYGLGITGKIPHPCPDASYKPNLALVRLIASSSQGGRLNLKQPSQGTLAAHRAASALPGIRRLRLCLEINTMVPWGPAMASCWVSAAMPVLLHVDDVTARGSPVLKTTHPSLPHSGCNGSGYLVQVCYADACYVTQDNGLGSTHGPRVTTRARSKRGSDAGAIDVRTCVVRYIFDCELECPANYGVPTSGRPRFICTGSKISP